MGPPIQTDPLRNFIRQRLTEKAGREGWQPRREELDEAVEHFARAPGNEYRQEFYRQQAARGQEEAAFAQPSGGALDALERVGRSAVGGMALGASSIPRFFMGDKGREWTESLRDFLPERSMGGRGSSPVGDVLESMTQTAGEMGASALPGVGTYKAAGTALNIGSKLPVASRVAAQLAPRAETGGAAISALKAAGRALPGEAVRGGAAGIGAMPYETLREGDPTANIAGQLAFGATGIGRRVSASLPEEHLLNKVVHQSQPAAPGAQPQLIDPEQVLAERARRRSGAPAPEAPLVDPAITQPVLEASKPISREIGSDVVDPAPGATAKPLVGGDPVDWNALDPTQGTQAREGWGKVVGNPQAIGQLLGIGESHLGGGGKKPDPRVMENITNAKNPEDLQGWLQARLVRQTSGAGPRYSNKAKPRKGKLPKAAGATEAPVVEQAAPAAPVTPEAPAPVAEPSPRPVTGKRPGRQDVLSNAVRTPDGMLDWDKLKPEERTAVLGMVGKSYREKIRNLSLERIQKTLSNGEFESFRTALMRQARQTATPVEAAPISEVANVLDEGLLPELGAPEEIRAGPVARRLGRNAIQREGTAPETATTPAPEAPAVEPLDASPGAATVDRNKVSPGWWDSEHATPEQKSALVQEVLRIRQMPGDAGLFAGKPFVDLPRPIREHLTRLDAPALPKAGGGAPKKGATFRRATGR